MPVSDSEYRAALTRAGDASAAEAVACRERDEARDDLRRTAAALLEARAIIRAACAALGASATSDLAADVARLAKHADEGWKLAAKRAGAWKAEERERAAAVATLRETQHALARVRSLIEWECTAREEARDALRSLLDGHISSSDDVRRRAVEVAIATRARWSEAPAASIAARIEAAPPVEAAPKVGDRVRGTVDSIDGYLGTIAEVDADDPGLPYLVDFGGDKGAVWLRANEIEPAPVEAAAVEAPHRVNDVWRRGDERAEVTSVDVDNAGSWLRFATRGSTYASAMEANGWRRVRCAPAVGDAVQTAGGDGAKAGELVALAGEE